MKRFLAPRSVRTAIVLAVAALVGTAHAEDDATVKSALDALSKPEIAEDAPPELVRIHELADHISNQGDLTSALEADEALATGDDAEALHRITTEVRIDLMEPLAEMADLVLALEEQGSDTAYYRARLLEIMPRVTNGLIRFYEAEQQRARALAESAAAASGADRAALERQVMRQDAMNGRIQGAGLTQLEILGALGMSTDEITEWLTDSVGRQARLLAGRIEMARTRLEDASARSDDAPEDGALKAEVSAARARHKDAVDALGTTVDRMKKLDLDTTQFKQLLIASTGEITTDIFDRKVASQLFSRWLKGVWNAIVENGPTFFFKVFLFSIVSFFFWTLSRFVRRGTQRALEMSDLGFSQLLKRMIVSVASATVLMMGLLVAFSQLGVEVGPMLAGLGIAGFVLGFALQDSLANFAAGIMILAYRPYDVGDLIDCAGGVFGKVSEMNLVSTTILTVDNQTRVVPNGKIWGDVITNVTAQKQRRVDLVVGISYDDDIAKTEEVIHEILAEHPKILKEPEAVVKLHELGDSSVNFVVRPWALRDDYWDVYWDVLREVKLRFDREGISIPFPQQDLHFKVDAPATTTNAPMKIGDTPKTGQTEPDADD